MVEAAVSFPSTSILPEPTPRSYEDAIKAPEVISARSLAEQDTLILRLLRPKEAVVFDAAAREQVGFEAYKRKGLRVIEKLRERGEKRRDIQKRERIEALKQIDARGYSFSQIINPIKL